MTFYVFWVADHVFSNTGLTVWLMSQQLKNNKRMPLYSWTYFSRIVWTVLVSYSHGDLEGPSTKSNEHQLHHFSGYRFTIMHSNVSSCPPKTYLPPKNPLPQKYIVTGYIPGVFYCVLCSTALIFVYIHVYASSVVSLQWNATNRSRLMMAWVAGVALITCQSEA